MQHQEPSPCRPAAAHLVHGFLSLASMGTWSLVWGLHWASRRYGNRAAVGVAVVLVCVAAVGVVSARWYESLPPEERRRLAEARRERAELRDSQAAARAQAEERAAQDRLCTEERTTAFVMSQEFVRQRLKSPSSARFPWMAESGVSVTPRAGCTYEVVAYVESQNGFGATIRTRYVAVLAPVGDSWELKSLRLLQ